jgi:hypothetical protein
MNAHLERSFVRDLAHVLDVVFVLLPLHFRPHSTKRGANVRFRGWHVAEVRIQQ